MRYKKVFSRLVTVFITLIFGFSLFVFITVIANWGSGVPNFYGYSFLSVRTQSMEPVYKVGSIVITKKIDTSQLKPGDVISFYSDDPAIYGIPNTHRIVSVGVNEVNKTYFVTKGDNNPVADIYKVYEDKVIGKVQGSIGAAGSILGKLKNRYVIFFVLIVPLALVALLEINNIKKLLRTKDNPVPDETTGAAGSSDGKDQDLPEKINRLQAEIDRLRSEKDQSTRDK